MTRRPPQHELYAEPRQGAAAKRRSPRAIAADLAADRDLAAAAPLTTHTPASVHPPTDAAGGAHVSPVAVRVADPFPCAMCGATPDVLYVFGRVVLCERCHRSIA